MAYVLYLYLDEGNRLAISENAPDDRPVLYRTTTREGARVQKRYYQKLIESGKLSMSDIRAGRIPD